MNKNEKLYFKINDGIIEKSSFIENKSIYKISERIKENKEKDENTFNYNNVVLSNQNFKFKKEIEILIRLYYYHKELKKQKKVSSYLLENNKETVYLINKLWIEKFKNFYEYKELELILEQSNNSIAIYQDKYHIYDYLIEEIISKLPLNYINKISKKNKNEFDNKPIKYDYIKINYDRREIYYLINNQIINYKIYELLISLGYNISNQIKTDLYFIEDNKLLLLFQFPSKETTEIGYINNENIFIPEFIIYNNENDISTNILNEFFSKYYSKFKSNQYLIQISCNNSKLYCYKLNNSMEINDNQYKNNLEIASNKTKESLREYSNNEILKKIELSRFTQNQIKALVLYYFFYLELEKDVKNSNIEIKNSECYLISKIWMNKFKEFYLYEKLVNNIKKIIPKLNANINSEIIDKIIYDKLDIEYLKEVNEKEADYPFF